MESYFEMTDQNHRAINYGQLRAQPVESLSAIYAVIAGCEHASLRLIANVIESTSFSKMFHNKAVGNFVLDTEQLLRLEIHLNQRA